MPTSKTSCYAGDGVLAGMASGGVIAIHSTIHPDTCRGLADLARRHGVAVVDAPVSGGGLTATECRLLVMVGGDEADIARCQPIFETYGNPVVHTGPLGSAQVAKLVNNLVFTAQVALALDTFAFADDLHIDRAGLARVLTNGSGGSRAVGILAMSGFDLAGLRHAVSLLDKDVRLIRDVASVHGQPLRKVLLPLPTPCSRHSVRRRERQARASATGHRTGSGVDGIRGPVMLTERWSALRPCGDCGVIGRQRDRGALR